MYHTVQMVLVDPCATSLWLLLAPAGDKLEHVRYVSPTHGRIQGMTKHKTGFPQPPKRTHMHIRRKHLMSSNKFQCEECSYTAEHKQMVDRHKKYVHRKQKDLICMECSKAFALRQELVGHVRKYHLNETTKVTCNICEKVLSSTHSLSYHMKRIHEETKVMCNICEKTISISGLSTHIKNVPGETKMV